MIKKTKINSLYKIFFMNKLNNILNNFKIFIILFTVIAFLLLSILVLLLYKYNQEFSDISINKNQNQITASFILHDSISDYIKYYSYLESDMLKENNNENLYFIQKLNIYLNRKYLQKYTFVLSGNYDDYLLPNLPGKYIVKNLADNDYRLLSQKFYNTPNFYNYIALANNSQNFDEILAKGQKIIIPEKPKYVPIIQYENVADIPHLPYNSKIIDEKGAILGTKEEIEFYVHVVIAEASQQWDYQGTKMIAESICNRVRTSNKSLHEILTQSKQYDVVSNGLYRTVKISDIQRQAAMDALSNPKNQFLPKEVLFFATKNAANRTAWFNKLHVFTTYRNVVFFSATPMELETITPKNDEDKPNDKINNEISDNKDAEIGEIKD